MKTRKNKMNDELRPEYDLGKLLKGGVRGKYAKRYHAGAMTDPPQTPPTILVFSAHAADFCSRSGGTIALYVSMGASVHVVDLTFGERGESEDYWSKEGPKSLAEAKKTRASEAQEAARILGASIEFMDYDDYPLIVDKDRLEALARLIRKRRPDVILTHWKTDPFNVDHEMTVASVVRAATIAAVPGFDHNVSEVCLFPQMFAFEPTVPRDDLTGFVPDAYVDITEIFETKCAALRALRSQKKLVPWYTQWAEYRGAQMSQWSGRKIKFAEAFKCYSAWVEARSPMIGVSLGSAKRNG
jgi:4-oxalomesaconate hydratase